MKNAMIVLLLVTASCDYSAIHEPGAPPTNEGQGVCSIEITEEMAAISYQQVRTEVFEPKCFSCHGNGSASGGVDLSTHASASPWATQIKFDVQNNIMPKPPNPPLNQVEKDLVVGWVDLGAPDSAGTGTDNCVSPSPGGGGSQPQQPIEEPLSEVPPDENINYNLVRNKIFKFRCFACHSTAGGNKDGLNLETYFNTIDEIDDILEEISEQSMPPDPRPPLNEIERTTIIRWIQLGSPE